MKIIKKTPVLLLVLTVVASALTLSASAQEHKYNAGDIIQFGVYPKNEVDDEELLAQLNELPLEFEQETVALAYNFNLDSFADVELNGKKYRALKLSVQRFMDSYHEPGNVYWFEFQPIDWIVLDPDTGLCISKDLIDAGMYSAGSYQGYAANNYVLSDIRKWLTTDFYQSAFSGYEQSSLMMATIEVDAYDSGCQQYETVSISDKVYLLSVDDVNNEEYGLKSEERWGLVTGYAATNGVSGDNYGLWYLRSMKKYDPLLVGACCCGNIGDTLYGFGRSGIRPAINICFHENTEIKNAAVPTCERNGYTGDICCSKCGTIIAEGQYIDKDAHSFGENGIISTQPTCTDDGEMTYVCSVCGETRTEPVEKTGHTDADRDNECDVCGARISNNPADIIIGIVNKIINFFKNLFGFR